MTSNTNDNRDTMVQSSQRDRAAANFEAFTGYMDEDKADEFERRQAAGES